MYVDEVKCKVVDRNVLVKLLDNPITSLDDYNNLLFSAAFWQQFETENLLGFQVDSLFNIKQKEVLQNIAEYDYVGGPWSDRIQRRWNYIPDYGGNGGVCFSKRSARLDALTSSVYPRVIGEPHNQILNEDIWFSHAINDIGGKIPNRQQAVKWFVESVYSEQPFALHKPWPYLSEKQFHLLCKGVPNLKALKQGCDKPSATVSQNEKEARRKFLLRFARICLEQNNFYQADLALQVCQERYPSHPAAFNLQALLAHRLGLYSQGLSFTEKALTIQPGFKKALENKNILSNLNDRVSDTKKNKQRYMLIHSWGSGLGFDLLYLLKQLMLAELTDRKPMVYWGKNSLYNDHPDSDCFTDYFDDISQATFQDIEPLHQECYPFFWQERQLKENVRRTRWRDKKNNQQYAMTGLYYLNRQEHLVVGGEFTSIKTLLPWISKKHRFYGLSVNQIYRDLMARYIKPQKFLISKVDDFIEKKIQQKDFIAIHLRGADKKQEKQSTNIDNINKRLIEQVAKLDVTLPIFVMTDDVRQIKVMCQRFGNRVQSIEVTRTADDKLGVHHIAENKSKIAQEVIVDMCIAAQAKYFFGCGFSYLACCVDAMRNETQITVLQPFDLMNRFIDVPVVGKFGIE